MNGVAYELPCATGLVFDEAQGTCVREEQASQFAKKCEKKAEKEDIEGFTCPDEETLGPHGQALAHPSFPHPLDCQKYITCFFGKQIQELGCPKGQVFDQNKVQCKLPEAGPDDW